MNFKNLEELMDRENNFDDKKFLEYLNSKEFQEKCSLKNFNFKDKNDFGLNKVILFFQKP